MADDERRGDGDDDATLRLPSLRSVLRRARKPLAEPARDDSTEQAEAHPRPAVPATMTAEPTEPEPAEKPARERRRWRAIRVRLPGQLASAVVGVLVGLVLVGLTAASLRACTSWRGTSSCGTPGILVLLMITAGAILLGSLLLRLTGVAAPGSTSFLAVAVLAVLILAALLPVLDHWWVVIVVPALSMLCYAGSWWLTTTYTDRPR